MFKLSVLKYVPALAIVTIAGVVYAQSAITVDIESPVDGAEFEVGQSIEFSGSATGGDSSTYAWGWDLNGEEQVATQSFSRSFDSVGQKNISLQVVDIDDGEGMSEITIDIVEESGSDELVISDIQVSDLTHNSATITWTTNQPATSRVIYDTESQSDISDQSAPDYGYQFSTTRDDDKVTDHSVTLTDLSAETQYFFRVLSAE
ncbi:MAG: fibronectin type III domain-containing protein [Patescibacteria group bacterium]